MMRTACGACGYDDLHTFLDLGLSPIADAYTSDEHELAETHPLQLAVCTGCWLVQLLEVVDHETLFGTGYSFYSSASPPLSTYHERYARDVLANYGALAKRGVLEVGCNDGDMLRHFAAADCPALGVDPALGPARVAAERGLNVITAPFTAQLAQRIFTSQGTAGVVVANHVLAHVENVADALEGISLVLALDGAAFVEVQYLPDLLVGNAFDLVYHEHRNFFSLTSLEKAAARWGLYVDDAQLTDRQGGSLRLTLRHLRDGARGYVETLRSSELWLSQRGAYDGFQGRIERVRARLRDLLYAERATGRHIVGYGAPAKATTLLNFCGVDAQLLDFIVDTTSAKQQRYVPGTGIRIHSPTDPEVALRRVDTYLLLAWNYAAQIMRNNSSFTDLGGRWILPVPTPTVL